MKMESRAQNNWIDTFLQEAEDLLSEIEEAALELSEESNSETIHRIFRAFHTIKGSSGMCGLNSVAEFTHHVESMLDKVRNGEIAATPELANLVLEGRDQVRAIISAEQGGEPVTAGSSEKLIAKLRAFAGTEAIAPIAANPPETSPSKGNSAEKVWEICFRSYAGLFSSGGNPVLLMRDLATLGTCEVTMHTDAVPPLEEIDPSACYLWWSATLHTSADQDAVRDVFMFVEDGGALEITKRAPTECEISQATAPSNLAASEEAQINNSVAVQRIAEPTSARALAKESTVRVPSGRLDRLVNLVGELVMNQSRLTQVMTQIGAPELANPVQEIERLVAELRDDVLGIRMLPIGTLFSRFRRCTTLRKS
jgi:two-component system chemotaxis sensor kinase CheA